MSADYDRLFHSPDAARTADESDRETPPAGRDTVAPPGGAPNGDATPPPMPAARAQAMQAPPSW
ncbi:ESX-1 associated ATP-binding protein EpsI N-terminal domain-containing protein, partial [Mycolicibacterium austroafricanum]